MAGQIKSKERVADHGEVFTNEREVNAMLDMVKPETERMLCHSIVYTIFVGLPQKQKTPFFL